MSGGSRVRTQSTGRLDRAERWAYVIEGIRPDGEYSIYVSDHRYHTAAAAQAAGEADMAASNDLIARGLL